MELYIYLQKSQLLSALGGFEKSHLPDIKCSCKLLNGKDASPLTTTIILKNSSD